MKRIRIIGVVALAAMVAVPAVALQEIGAPPRPRNFRPFQGKPPDWRGPGGDKNQPRRNRPHIGQWLKKNQNLPVDQQEQALRSDPEFQKLPAQQQQHLLDRLHQFNSLPPNQRQRMLSRMDAFEHLTPEQQQQARQIFGQVRQMPEDRRQSFRKGLRQLADMPPDQRQAALDSPAFRKNFSDEERGLMRQVVDLNVLPERGAPENAPAPPDQR